MNDIMSAKGRKNYLFAIPIMVGSVLLFLSLVWLAKAQPGGNNPSPAVENTNCPAGTNIVSCSPGSITFCCSSVTNCGLPVIITDGTNKAPGQEVTTITNTDCSTNNNTNIITPTITSGPTWTDAGDNQSGNGLSATIHPTAMSGSVTFNFDWSNVCTSTAVPEEDVVLYQLTCPFVSSCTPASCFPPDLRYGASIIYNWKCASGWFLTEGVTVSSNSCNTNNVGIQYVSNYFQIGSSDTTTDTLENVVPPGTGFGYGSCCSATTQIIYLALNSATANSNDAQCKVTEKIAICVNQTNNASYPFPAMGNIITTVSFDNGVSGSNVCPYTYPD